MLTRQQLPAVAIYFSTWLAAISLSLPWVEGRGDADGFGAPPSGVGGYWLATDETGPVWFAVILLAGTVTLLVLGGFAAGTSISWTGVTLSGVATGLLLIVGPPVSAGLDGGSTPLAGFFLWRGALVGCVIAGVWHSLVTDGLLRTEAQAGTKTD